MLASKLPECLIDASTQESVLIAIGVDVVHAGLISQSLIHLEILKLNNRVVASGYSLQGLELVRRDPCLLTVKCLTECPKGSPLC